jgi:IS30 family transposase
MIDIFSNIPKEFRKTNTLDNGPEFTSWEKIKEEFGIEFYFTHPYSSREK